MLIQKNAQNDTVAWLEAERAAHDALQQVAEKHAVENDDGDAELAELDANTSRRISVPTNDFMSGTGVVCLTATPPSLRKGSLSPEGSIPRGTPTREIDVQSGAAKPGGCCSVS